MKTRVVIGADHGGLALKNDLYARLRGRFEIADLGAFVFDPEDDYPDLVLPVARAVASGRAGKGILVCGSGVGACIAANKVPGVRACLCHDVYSSHQGVEHDDMNVLCLGSRVIGLELADELSTAFLGARFKVGERFQRRLQKVMAIERESLQGGTRR